MSQYKTAIKIARTPTKKAAEKKPKPGTLPAFEIAMQIMKEQKLDFSYLN